MIKHFLGISILSTFFALAATNCSSDSSDPAKQDQLVTTDSNTITDHATSNSDANNPTEDGPVVTPDVQVQSDSQTTVDLPLPDSAQPPQCGTCHALPPTTGKHTKHVNNGRKCSKCHSEVVDDNQKIIDATLHNNGTKNVKGTFTYDAATKQCSSVGCHGSKTW